jgi:4-amino-4-deoxy-L-arabinose transferase-like glycosyltransferase
MNDQHPIGASRPRWWVSPYFILGAIFLIKAVVLLAILPTGDVWEARYSVGFADDYDRLANNIALGNGYRIDPQFTETMLREPGYPLFLAVVFKLGGYHIEGARLANLLLSIGICWLIVHLTLRMVGDRTVGLVAAMIYSLHPGVVVAEARGGVEILFIASVLLFFIVLHSAVTKGDYWRYLVAGGVLGMSVLIRSSPLLFPVLLGGFMLLMARGWHERSRVLQRHALLVLGLAIVMSPWVIRNYAISQAFVPTGTVQGHAAQEGLYTCKRLSLGEGFQKLQGESAAERNNIAKQMGVPFRGGYYQFFHSAKDEVFFNRQLLQTVASEYRNDPMLLARCASRNVVYFWFLGKNWQATGFNVAVQLPLLLLALGGIYLLYRQGRLRSVELILLFSVYVMAVHLPIIAHARHSIPLVPFLAMLAGVSLVALRRRYARPEEPAQQVFA